jgi:chemotaxis protein histidine kinase CheA
MEKSGNTWKIALACVLVAAIVAIVVLCVNHNGQMSNLKDELTSVQEQKKALDEQKDKDATEISTLTKQVETLTGEVEASKVQIETLTTEKTELAGQVEKLQSDLAEKEETLNSMKDFFVSLFEGTGLLDEEVADEGTEAAPAAEAVTEAATEAVAEEATTEAVAETVAEEAATEAVTETVAEEAATEAVAETVAEEAATEAVAATVAEEAATETAAEAVSEGTEAAPEATAEAVAEGTEEAEAPAAKYADEHPGVVAFDSIWVTDDGAAVVNLGVRTDGVEVVVVKKTGEKEWLSWEYLPAYDDEKKILVSTGNGMKSTNVEDADGNVSAKYEYEDGSATFSLDENGDLIWKDEKEDAGAGLAFHKTSWFAGAYVCDRAQIEIHYVPTAKNYSVEIHWADSANESNDWLLTGTYQADTNTLTVSGTEKKSVYAEGGELTSEETVAEIKDGTISFDDQYNLIVKGVEGIAETMAFESQFNDYWMN